MRGARKARLVVLMPLRIIPAYAGSTRRMRTRSSMPQDHPRVCGEHGSGQMIDAASMGSSPRMRGAPESAVPDHQAVRIIPAYAGSTPTSQARGTPPRDHPRVCGEHIHRQGRHACAGGSSPRMRGAPQLPDRQAGGARIIPAYAGSTDESYSRTIRR